MKLADDIRAYWPLLAADGVYYLFTGLSSAVVNKEVYAVLSPRLISLQSIIGWGGGISDKIYEGAKAWFFKKSEARASFDNLIDMTGSIAGFSGYAISVLYVPSLRIAILCNFIATFCYCAGIIWYTVAHNGDLKTE